MSGVHEQENESANVTATPAAIPVASSPRRVLIEFHPDGTITGWCPTMTALGFGECPLGRDAPADCETCWCG